MPPILGELRTGPCTGAGVVLAVALVLGGCTSGGDTPAASPTSAPTTGAPSFSASIPPGPGQPVEDPELTVHLEQGPRGPQLDYTLRCHPEPAGGTEDPAATCAHLDGLTDPFAPVPADAVCTEQFGGPQTARVTGEWQGRPVDLQLSRTDGCRIAQWDRLGPLLPGPVG